MSTAIAAREIIKGKLSSYPDHGAGDAVVKHTLTGEELVTILDALADQAIALEIARNEIARLKVERLKRTIALNELGALDGETLP